jgi:murein L,D-transpeptidase YafK
VKVRARFIALLVVAAIGLGIAGCSGIKPRSAAGEVKAGQPLKQSAIDKLKSMGSAPGEGTVLRIFKESSELEVWKRTASGSYKHFRTYEICAWSGGLGPKMKEGDRQAPEGFYTITPALMNPYSGYYLSFDTGYPNKFDRAHGRTGSNLMIHGDCSSRGCYSITDEAIAEVYALIRETFRGGHNSVQLQIFPFRMTPQNLARHADSPHMSFWQNIKEGYDRFELAKAPAEWDVCEKQYVFDIPRSGQALDAAGMCPSGPRGSDVMIAALATKQAADRAAMETEVAALAAEKAAADAAAQAKAAEQAALQARGNAIGDFVGSIFGGKDAGVRKVIDPTLVAPVPAPRIQRS